MNQYLPYEKAFARKMEELPLPDRQEAIWKAVQLQIGASAPGAPNEGTSISQKVTVSSGKIVTGLIITVIVIVITVLVANRKKKATQNQKAAPEMIQPQAPAKDNPLPKEQKKNSALPFKKANTVSAIPPQISIDTSANLSPVFPVIFKPDSNKLQIKAAPPKDAIAKPPVFPPNKKSIGVQGISDSSYRISGRKDSL